jgi:tripartite-type tricarboxylate transporter receptor subunit TctC
MPPRSTIGKWSIAVALVAGIAAALACRAHAQTWPNRHVRLIVPYPAGGGADAIARIVGARLSELWGQQVLIENRGGAGGNIASEAAAHSAPDGYTLYLAGEFLANNSFLYPKLSYDPIADFTPVSLVVQYPTVIVVPNSSPARARCRSLSPRPRRARPCLLSPPPAMGPAPILSGNCSSARPASK